jgi:predicted acylesterase/phospholipase RssA
VVTALVLSAGGMFAAWEAGVWRGLAGHVGIDLVVGASAGAWNGWLIAGGAAPEEVVAEWRDPSIAATWVFRPGLLQNKAQDLFSRFQPRIPFGLTVVEVPHFRSRLVRSPDVTWQHLAATCSIPGAFPAVAIQDRQFVDGGLLGALPLWAAEEMGATHVLALNCLTNLSFRVLHALLRPRGASRALDVTLIEPSEQLGSVKDTVCWSHSNIERWIELGERDAKRVLSAITI